MVLVGLLAGKGVFDMAEKVITRIAAAPEVRRIWVLTPTGRYRDYRFFTRFGTKLKHINSWVGPDSHDATAPNRERLRRTIFDSLKVENPGWSTQQFARSLPSIPMNMPRNMAIPLPPPAPPRIEWVWIGDEDALPAENYFRELVKIRYDYPVLMTGRTNNMDGRRWYDWAGHQVDGLPFCIPYHDWDNPRYEAGVYASGNQHLFNRAGFDLNIPYPDVRGEDPHMCWAFRRAGGRLVFRPELLCTLQKLHPDANFGHPPALPPLDPTHVGPARGFIKGRPGYPTIH